MTLHIETLTPTQRIAAAHHESLKQRIASKARLDSPIACVSASVRATEFESPKKRMVFEPEHPPLTIRLWVEHELLPYDRTKLRVEDIQIAVSDYYHVDVGVLRSDLRFKDLMKPRHIAMFLSRCLMPHYSLPAIGRKFNNRDHSTVLHAVRKIYRLKKEDEGLAKDLEVILLDLGSRFVLPPAALAAL